MNVERISALLLPFLNGEELASRQLEEVRAYLSLLLKWNARINLTAVRHEDDIITRHFGESFFAAKQILSSRLPCSAIDFGSGAGFPGLPLAIFSPATNVTLIESHGRKAVFLKEVIRELHLKNASVFAGRGEVFPSENTADVVTLRAVEKFPASAAIASRLVTSRGRLALLISEAQVSLASNSFRWDSPIPIPGSTSRVLLIGNKA